MPDTKIKTLMTKNVTTVKPEDPFTKAIRLMGEKRFSCMVVVENKMPVGILTERDTCRVVAEHLDQIKELKVSDVMTTSLILINDTNTLYEAMVIAGVHKIRHLPVINNKSCLAGILTQTDLTRAYCSLIERKRQKIEEEVAKTKRLMEANERLKELSFEDPMLQIGNRRAMEVDLTHTHAYAVRYQQEYSVALLDIDYFKSFNDYYGHLEGDKSLIKVVNTIKHNIRTSDRFYRYGGEEFLLLMPHTSHKSAELVVERLVQILAQAKIKHEKSPYGNVTMSAGVACFSELDQQRDDFFNLIKLADKRVYKAKADGRNCLYMCAKTEDDNQPIPLKMISKKAS